MVCFVTKSNFFTDKVVSYLAIYPFQKRYFCKLRMATMAQLFDGAVVEKNTFFSLTSNVQILFDFCQILFITRVISI